MNVLSLFAGIGGLELGLERAGMTTVGQVEIDPWCRQVLTKHWPEVPKHDDVRTAGDWWNAIPRPPVHVVCGGYPCQPFSTAGNMRADDDPRHLWPAFAHVLRAVQPSYAILENVASHLRIGFDRVLADLAELGFDAEWSVVRASGLGALHHRPRLFVLAYAHESELGRRGGLPTITGGRWGYHQQTDYHGCRSHLSRPSNAEPWTSEPDVDRMADGLSGELDRHRLHALGNAVVPQVAEHVGRLIVEQEQAAA